MNDASDAVLMVAARCPVPGETKTRLGRVLGMPEAARLYGAFLQDLAVTVVRPLVEAGVDVVWTFSPPDGAFAEDLGSLGIDTSRVATLPQSGETWAIRQDNLMRWADGRGYRRSILIASDSPQLTFSPIAAAFDALNGHDLALGRVIDGGYYLIGMAGYHDVLLNVPMSTGTAAEALAGNVGRLGRTLYEAPVTFDIDEVEDLQHLIAALAPGGQPCPATWAALHDLGLIQANSP
jgi:glycosyltransferase A (GT-A) superfamily protein (DUF2064 family)